MFDAQILILDDGFQHHRLARDLDLVCMDGAAGFGNRHVVPWGPLREPLSALRHADWLCVVDGGEDEKESKLVERFVADGGRILRAWRRPSEIISLDQSMRQSTESLAGRSVGLLAGVGRPGSVRRSLEQLGAKVVAERLFPDHHAYREADFGSLDPNVPEWITTEKDALKILPKWIGAAKMSVLRIEVEFEQEDEALDSIESALFDSRR